jgi:hypothetical protein
MKHRSGLIAITLCVLIAGGVEMTWAASAPLTFAALTGSTGGVSRGTIVFHANSPALGLTSIESTTLTDVSRGVGEASGQFSDFDLDAIRLSTSSVGTAPSASALAGLSVFDLSPAGTLFTPGTQCAPLDPALFGTLGSNINNSVVTLDAFDGNSTTGLTANGFIGLGNAGMVSFHLISAVARTGLFHYLGETGGNDEVLAGRLIVLGQPNFSGSTTLLLLGSVVGGLAVWRRTKKN